MLAIVAFLTPIVAIIFFVNCVALAKKIRNGDQDTANHTGWGAIMFAFLVTMIVWSSLASH